MYSSLCQGALLHGLYFSSRSFRVLAYTDVDWAEDIINRHSTMGFYFLLGDSFISWRSKKNTMVAHSSTEVEYHALANATSKLFWLR